MSSDPFVTPEGRGTEFPITKVEVDDPLLVLHAVSAVTRTCLDEMEHRGGPRTLYLRAARELCPGASFRQIGSLVNAGERTAQRAAKKQDSRIQMVARAVSDPRFPPLTDVPIRWENPYYRK